MHLIAHVVKPTLVQFQRADVKHDRIIPGDRPGEGTSVILHIGLLVDARRDVRNLRKIGGKHLYIFLGEADRNPSFLPACLHGGLTRHDDDEFRPEIGEDCRAGLAKTIAIGEQHDYSCNAPSHAKHGERGPAPIVTHGRVGFL